MSAKRHLITLCRWKLQAREDRHTETLSASEVEELHTRQERVLVIIKGHLTQLSV